MNFVEWKNEYFTLSEVNEIYFGGYINDFYLDGHFNFIKVLEEKHNYEEL